MTIKETKSNISVLAISLIEEKNIISFLEKKTFAKEIILLNYYNTKHTITIARGNEIKTIEKKFTNYTDQKNFALTIATNDWILFLDLDEVLTADLENEINTIDLQSEMYQAYLVNREFYFFDKKIKFGGVKNTPIVRLLNKRYCSFSENKDFSDKIIIKGKTGTLKNPLEHNKVNDLDSYNNKLLFINDIIATDLYTKNKKAFILYFFTKPLKNLINQYILKLGFLDGKKGFILAYIHSFAIFIRHIKLWLKYRKMN